jgi:ABC-type uncharacterized transport system permease subunit
VILEESICVGCGKVVFFAQTFSVSAAIFRSVRASRLANNAKSLLFT